MPRCQPGAVFLDAIASLDFKLGVTYRFLKLAHLRVFQIICCCPAVLPHFEEFFEEHRILQD